jgi:hypothetical protein
MSTTFITAPSAPDILLADDDTAQAVMVRLTHQPLKLSLLAIATELVSSLSVNTWNSSSAPRRSSSI